ncbi:synaptonemal complex protein 2-like isoform X4 [Dicentrarchus labrax]|uniref:synaptonemal complex protein 2-like isoform X4 n=1 Tax=Dicentrarchus labrax TaxID=13489 RepID=UPI0021F5566A|nr:synaptonemal complex protein 2-like isoform X4 [Dicentrarchus labrax]
MLKMEDCLIRGNSSDLVSVLHSEGLTSITLTTLDQLVTTDLCGSGFSRVLVVLKSLQILSENRDDLHTLLHHGLTAKVLLWFEAVHDLLTSDLQKNSASLLSLTEEFYDYFLLLGQASLPVSQLSVVLLQLARFALEPEIHFPLRLEAIRTFNSILESLSREQRRLIQNDQNQIQILSQMSAAVLTAGDYELQVSLSEALCRLTPRKDREQRANQWFSSCDISTAFCDIRDGDFEVDCRRFLNFINGHHGDQRRVYSFPCLRAFLDSTELFPPKDDKLDKFWIDFNLSSGCVSFFIDEPQGFLWGSVHLLKEEVDRYSVQLKRDGCSGAETVLSVQLNNPIMHHNSRGQTVELNFDCEHHRELEEAAGRVFMKGRSSPCVESTGGTVQVFPSAAKQSGRSYSRKKPQSKSQLKILPLSSPSSEDDSSVMKIPGRSTAEFLFDQIRHSTPTYDSGVPVPEPVCLSGVPVPEPVCLSGVPVPEPVCLPGVPVPEPVCLPGVPVPEMSQEETDVFRGSSSPFIKEVLSCGRKRATADSGYLSDQTEGVSAQKKRAGPQTKGEEPKSPLTEGLPEGAEPPEEEEEEEKLFDGGAEEGLERKAPIIESDLTSGITAAFNTFRTHLEQHFTGCWRNVEAQVLLSLKECQQHVASLLTAVHQHRLVLLQTFESNVSDQLNRLQEYSSNLNNINTQILTFFQSEMQRLGSFCDEHLQRLKSLERGESGAERPFSQ